LNRRENRSANEVNGRANTALPSAERAVNEPAIATLVLRPGAICLSSPAGLSSTPRARYSAKARVRIASEGKRVVVWLLVEATETLRREREKSLQGTKYCLVVSGA